MLNNDHQETNSGCLIKFQDLVYICIIVHTPKLQDGIRICDMKTVKSGDVMDTNVNFSVMISFFIFSGGPESFTFPMY